MIDHITLGSNNVLAASNFYDAILKTIGYERLTEEHEDNLGLVAVGYGHKDKAVFWICLPLEEGSQVTPSQGTHIAFKAENPEQVKMFYKTAMDNGAKDCGEPGPRPIYHENYYAAYLYDLDGHKIEVVCRN